MSNHGIFVGCPDAVCSFDDPCASVVRPTGRVNMEISMQFLVSPRFSTHFHSQACHKYIWRILWVSTYVHKNVALTAGQPSSSGGFGCGSGSGRSSGRDNDDVS